MQNGIIILSTYPDEQTAVKITKNILKSKLTACVNLTSIRSLYWWKDRIEDSNECLVIFKSTSKKARALKETIAKSHPYEVPEIIEIRMNSVSNSYLRWMIKSVLA